MAGRPGLWVAAAVFVVALAGAPTAKAQTHARVDIECAWSAMPQDAREAFLAAAPDPDRMSSVAEAQGSAVTAAAKRCHLSLEGDDATLYGQALTSKVLEVWSADQLRKHANVDDAAIDRAWKSLPAAERASIAREVKGGLSASKAETDDLERAGAALGVHDEEGLKYIAFYFAARALLTEFAGVP